MVPAVGSRSMRLANLVNTVTGSSTFQKLVGASSSSVAAASVYIDLALDDGSAPFPRAVIRHSGPQSATREGTDTYLGEGQLAVFVQYVRPAPAAELAWFQNWYTGISGPFAEADYRQHMNNLMGQMSDDWSQLATTAGCLEFQKLEEYSCGEVDEKTENGLMITELTWVIYREGLP